MDTYTDRWIQSMDRCRRQVCCVLHDTETCARAYTHTHTYIHTYTHTHLRASAREVPKRAIDHRRCVCPGVVCRGLRVCPRVFECVCVCVCVRACVCACVVVRACQDARHRRTGSPITHVRGAQQEQLHSSMASPVRGIVSPLLVLMTSAPPLGGLVLCA